VDPGAAARSALHGGLGMSLRTFSLAATIVTTDPSGVRAVLSDALGRSVVVCADGQGLSVAASGIVGVEARELNRRLFSAVLGVDDAARLRSEWTADGVAERFRGYVYLKDRG
jgi:hypothetical protein